MVAATETSAPRIALPYRFGPTYTLFDRIGAGGMAEIFLARRATRIGATGLAVVKLVLPSLAGDSRFASMLTAEAKLAARLSHANVVQTYDLGREDGRLYIAMEYVEGFDLNELLRRCSKARVPLPAEYALFIAGETLRALDYAHRARDSEGKSLGIVHRDVSPSNVLISFEGEVKLCDFGIARATDTREDLGAEAIEGKAAYMSPEHARGDAIDGRADVFAASVLLWEMLAGRRLYKPVAGGPDALSMARAADVPELPDRGLPEHARIAAVLAKGLAREPGERYPTAMAMAREIDAYMMASGLRASPLKLGQFLMDQFGAEIVEARRARERSAALLEGGDDAAEYTTDREPVPAGLRVGSSAIGPDDRATDPGASPPEAPRSLPPSEPGATVEHSDVRLRAPDPNPSLVPPVTAPEPAPQPEAAPIAPAPAPKRGGLAMVLLLAVVGVVALAAAIGYLLGHR